MLLSASIYLVNLAGDAGTSTGSLSGDIRYCITQADQSANAGSSITFDTNAIGSNTIVLSGGELAISDNMTIQGPGTSSLTISGGNNSRIFDITSNTAVVAISGLTVSGGTSNQGGGIYNAGSLTVSDSTLSSNTASNDGGGIYNSGTMTVSGCTLSGNTQLISGGDADGGGAIFNGSGSTMLVSNSTLSSNSAAWDGGGIYNYGSLTVSDSAFSGNSALSGGGIGSAYSVSSLTVSDSTFYGNTATAYGGGIACGGQSTVSDSTLSGNSAGWGGGSGIFNNGTLTVSDITLSGNSADTYGGGIDNWSGGGTYGSLTVSNSTLSGNSAGSSGGGIANSGSVVLHNTLIAGNVSGSNPSDVSGSLDSASDYNLIGDGSGGLSTANHNLLGSSASPLNPLLAPLGNYGGPTQTMALLPGSPAIDAGSSAYGGSTDQRGEPRVGPTDIGAFEYQGSTTAGLTLSVTDAGGTYNGSAFPAAGTALGTNNQPVSGSFSYAYYVGSSASGTPSATAPSNAGTYTVVATFISSEPNYASGGTAQTTFTIKPATPTLSVADAGGTYNGSTFPATGTALGLDGKTAVNGSFSYAYYVGSSASGTPSATAPSTAGTYTVVATFTSSDPNYASGGTAQTTFTINPGTAATNLIVNGDFESGNTGFTTGYTYSPGNIGGEGTYDILTNPHNSHPGGQSYGDHTTGHGLMMALNGAPSYPTIVWQETVSVQPNTSYQFSGWVSNWSSVRDSALPDLNFNFNSVLVGQFNVPPNEPIGPWDNVTFTWNSKNNSTLNITIIDAQTARVGNDFALDDLSLQATGSSQPTLTVTDAGGTYNGSAFPATAKAVGVDGKTVVNGSFSYAYYVGSSASGTPSATAPTNAGTYTVVATFTSSDPNYASGGTAQTTFTIKPATPIVSVADVGGTYNGNAFPATAKALGVDGKTPVSGSFSYAYYAGSSAIGAALATAPTNAGTYTVVATFTSSDPNYSNGTAQNTFTIATATTAVSSPTMPPQPSTVPMSVLVQMTIDVVLLPDWSKVQAFAMLETMLWMAYSTASAESPQLASDLIWAEMGLTWDLLLVGNQPLLLVNNPHSIALANAIDQNPLYHTPPGWILANALAERLLIV